VFDALRDLRQQVIADMNEKGASLPTMRTFTFNASLPSAALALRLYRDPGRADEISSETGAPHPAFQPFSFQGLSA
jgi:prophage DNA circulation protein